MSLIHKFCEDPPDFLKTKVVYVPMQEPEAAAPTTPKWFWMEPLHADSNVVQLKFRIVKPDKENAVKAYWLPWGKEKALTLTLGGAAEFMFTTELTNCRFSVLTKDPKAPLIGHVAGTGSATQRDAWELKEKFPKRGSGSEDDKKMRRLSKSINPDHLYRGQADLFDDSSSAFVFGRRVNEVWSFYAQIVQGKMTGDEVKKPTFPKQIKQLGELYRIDA